MKKLQRVLRIAAIIYLTILGIGAAGAYVYALFLLYAPWWTMPIIMGIVLTILSVDYISSNKGKKERSNMY